ncbi:uncharacterized protein LOC144626580 [Crassostrea virginica]
MHHIPRLSEAVYVGMCCYVGSPTEVRIRREVTDTDEAVCRPVWIMRGWDRILSGSRREGFRLKTSDRDAMFWLPDHKVICDISQISLYRIPQHTVILMECEDLPPGFTRLKLMTPSPDQTTLTLHRLLCQSLQFLSWFLSGQITEEISNKKRAYICDNSLKMMKLASKIGCVSDILYLAMLYYKNCHYEQSLRCLQRAQEKMSKPYVIYRKRVNEEMYRRVIPGMSLSDRMRKCVIYDICLHEGYVYIDELVPEQEVNKSDGSGVIIISPLVMLHMLFVLDYHRLGDIVRSQQSLQDLHTLLLYDDVAYVPMILRDISWQILGICQQTCGDYVGALNSFQCSLQQQKPFNAIQKATMFRIQGINDFLLQI